MQTYKRGTNHNSSANFGIVSKRQLEGLLDKVMGFAALLSVIASALGFFGIPYYNTSYRTGIRVIQVSFVWLCVAFWLR
ncbi:hypothetical protein BDZ45DRAFT_333454 [Acephala macrosclerotiorum]|nr:hypothetical protein BDZ45DRAFT_333454 [Acephala macrosclerotiorum]